MCYIGNFDNGTASVYLNGKMLEETVGFKNVTEKNVEDMKWLNLGHLHASKSLIIGLIANVQVWNRSVNTKLEILYIF